MLDAKPSWPGLFLLMVGVVAAGCGEPQCPKGFFKKGDTCYRNRDGGVTDAGDDELDASDVELEDSSSSVTTGDSATDPDAGSQADAASLGDGSSDPCQGSGGAALCMGSAIVHCSPQGLTESTDTCASPQQCQLGIAADRCAPCMPGKFQCTDVRLERCANDGSGWELFTTCDSAALCNATAGACTDKACTPTTRVCTGDTLNGCNASMTALAPIMTCDAGMCDQAQGECDVCVANGKECQGDVAVTCDANGRQELRNPCQGTTPRCTGSGRCVQCVGNTDCKGEHELCVDSRCEVQPYCGDGRVTSGEACDPAASGWNLWTCNTSCTVTTAYTSCSGNMMDAQGNQQGVDCNPGEFCFLGICAPRCNLPGDCPSSPVGSATCTPTKHCALLDCNAASECAPGLVCVNGETNGNGCFGCSASSRCPSGTNCQLYSGLSYGKCI